jgi:hypothetical protein
MEKQKEKEKKKESWVKRFLNWIATGAKKEPPSCCGK